MFTLKLFVLFVIVQNTVSSLHWSNWNIVYPTESSETFTKLGTTPPGSKYVSKFCPEKDHSLISYNDLKYMIEDMAAKLKFQDNLVNIYYPEAEEILHENLEELEQFREELKDRPEHMLHILENMSDLRQKREPAVRRIADQLQELDNREEKYNDIAERSVNMLKQLEKYKRICQIECEDYNIDTRFRHNVIHNTESTPLKYTVNNDMVCIRLKDLNEYLTAKLIEFEEEYDQVLLSELEARNAMYAQKIIDLKMNFKTAAVKQFGMTMYDILCLQDDYYHFVKELKKINISAELDHIDENSAEIKLKLIGLKRDIEKYRQHCMNCNNNGRVKRNAFDSRDNEAIFSIEDADIPVGNKTNDGSDIIDELIKAKVNESIESIKSNITEIFNKLDEELNNPDVIDSYVTKLQPIQEKIKNDIITEQKALHNLRNIVPESSIKRILALSKESKQMILSLESAKQYIDKFIS